MPMSMLRLKPGANVEVTATQLEAGYAQTQFGRFRAGLFEKLGGWARYYQFAVGGVPKTINAWLDLNNNKYLGVGSTTLLGTITNSVLTNITPQALTSDFAPDFATTNGSPIVTITDPNIANVTTFDGVEFETPVTIGGIVLSGAYPITLVLGSTNYQITASNNATETRQNFVISGATKANPCVVTATGHDFANGDLVYITGVVGMTQLNGNLYTVAGMAANTFQLSGIDSTGYTTYTSGGVARIGQVPYFTTTSGSAIVTVTLQNHGLLVGYSINLPISTTVGGVTLVGTFDVVTVSSTSQLTIVGPSQASSSTSAFMNSGNAEIIYRIAIGPQAASTGYSIGTYSSGSYSTGSSPGSQTGTPITATGWSLDNWGQVLLAVPDGGGLYAWQPTAGFQNAQFISGAPISNAGMFISQATQMVIMYGSASSEDIGYAQDPLLVQWSAQGDYTSWAVSSTSQAGSRRLPNGSKCISGLSVPTQELIWTDLDLWGMSYLGFPDTWGFTKIGSNCGAIAKHAVAKQGSTIYWMGQTSFFVFGGGAPAVLNCNVWDTVFQNLNTTYQNTCWAWSNTAFNEIWFFFPRQTTGATTPDYFVKYNTLTGLWDNGAPLDRTCGIDVSLLGMPISATSGGIVYQHEISPDADGQAINASFTTGFFELSEGQDLTFVDWFLPDAKYTMVDTTQAASLQITYYAQDYQNGPVRTVGPLSFSSTTQYLNPRIRGRYLSFKLESNDVGSFWRTGGCHFRSAPDGRR